MPDTYIQLPDNTYVQIPEGTSPDKLAAFKTKLAQRFPAKVKTPTSSSNQPIMRASGPAEDRTSKLVSEFRQGYFKGDLSKNIPGQLVQRLVKNPNDKAALEQVARFRSPIAQQAVHEEVSERRGRTVGGSMPLSYQAQQISKEGGLKAGVGGNILPLFESMVMDPVNLMLMGAGAAPEEAAAKAIGGGVGKVVGKLRGASAGRAAELTAARVVPKAVRATMGGAIAAQVAPKIAEGIKEKDYPKAIGSAIIGGIALVAGLRGIREPEVPSGVVQKPTGKLSEADIDAALKRTVPSVTTKKAGTETITIHHGAKETLPRYGPEHSHMVWFSPSEAEAKKYGPVISSMDIDKQHIAVLRSGEGGKKTALGNRDVFTSKQTELGKEFEKAQRARGEKPSRNADIAEAHRRGYHAVQWGDEIAVRADKYKPKGEAGATVQAKQEQSAATPDVRAGEGGEAGKGRGQGKGQGQQGEAAAGTRQAQEKIRAAAIRHPQTGETKEGPDHPTILKQEGIEGFNTRKSRETPEFGFVTTGGRFVTREEAANIARISGQQKAPFTITKEGKTIAHADQIDMTPPFHEGLRTAYDAVLKENPQLDRDTVPIGTVYRMAKRMKLIPSDMTIDQFVAEGHKVGSMPEANIQLARASTDSRNSRLKKYSGKGPDGYDYTYSYVREPGKGAATPTGRKYKVGVDTVSGFVDHGEYGSIEEAGKAAKEAAKKANVSPDIVRVTDITDPLKPVDVSTHAKSLNAEAPPTTPPTEKVAAGTAPEEDKPIGIAERVRRRMAEQGRAAPYEAGQGASPAEMRVIGREMAKEISDPNAYLTDMERAGVRFSGDDLAYLRHVDEQNVKVADQAKIAADRNPLDPKLQKAAQDAASARDAWYKRISKYRTEWERAGAAQQGSEDADTGEFSLTHFTEHFEDVNKRPMTPEEKQHAEKVNLKTAELSDSIKKDEAALDTELKKSAPKQRKDDLPSDPEQLKAAIQKMREDGTFRVNPRQTRQTGAFRVNRGAINPKVARAVWNHAKAHYIDIQATLGMPVNFDDMVNGTATDLGMPPDEVREAFASNKNVQNITLGMYRKRAERAYAISQARQWLADRNAPGYTRVYRAITNIPRGFKVFGHGTVGMITHAGPTLFSSLSPGITIKGKTYLKGSTWDEYWPNFFRQFKWFAGPGATARHNAAMADLIRHPRFGEWKSAGLAIDPRTVYDNYQAYGKWIGSIGRLGNNGMDALKTFRLAYAEKVYAGLSASAKADPDAMALIARSINHITGATESRLGRASGLLFAPSLEIARWQRYGDVGRATGTIVGTTAENVLRSIGIKTNWVNASPAEKFMAGWQAKRAMEMTAVYMGTLVANDQLNRKLKSGHYVNFSDPTKSDFLKPKWGDRVYDPTGGAINPARVTATIMGYAMGKIDPPTFRGRQLRKREAIVDRGTQYLQGKFNPAIQAGLEGASQEDFLGRPLPFSKEQGTPYRPKYEWGEYAWTQAPIPFAGAADIFYDEMRKQGVDHATSQIIADGLMAWATEMVGVRTSPEPGTYMPAKRGSVLGGKLPK